MAPKVYQGRGEAAQKTDVPRKKIDAQNSTEAGVMRSIVNDHFSVDYLEGVQEFPAQVLRVLKESKEYRNFRESSTSFLGGLAEGIAAAFGAGKQRYIVRVFAVDMGIPAPDDFGTDERNTINDAIIDLHAHHEMVPADESETYNAGDIVIVKFNNNVERTDGVIIKKAGDSEEKDGSPSPTNPNNYDGAAGAFSGGGGSGGAGGVPGTIGCAPPSNPTEANATATEKPPPTKEETTRKSLEELQLKNIDLESKILDLNNKNKAINAKSKKTPEDEAAVTTNSAALLPLEQELEKNKQEYVNLSKDVNTVELQKQEVKIKIEVGNKKNKELTDKIADIEKKIKAFRKPKTDKQKIDLANLINEKTGIENEIKALSETTAKLLEEQKKLDTTLSVQQQPTPPPPPTPCVPQIGVSNAGGGNAKFPTSAEKLTLIRAVVKGCRSMGFTNTNFIAAVCANIEKETGWKIRNEYDYGGTSAERLRVIFGKRLAQFNDQELYQLAFRNEEFYDYIYGYKTKTLGKTFENTEPGDGYKYRGRGFVGYTGKGLYKRASMAIFKDDRLVKNPDMANQPETNGKFLAYYLSITVGRWEKIFGVSRNTVTPDQACALITSCVGGTNILKAVEKEKAAGKTIKDGIWIQIYTKVTTFFPKYVEEASKQ